MNKPSKPLSKAPIILSVAILILVLVAGGIFIFSQRENDSSDTEDKKEQELTSIVIDEPAPIEENPIFGSYRGQLLLISPIFSFTDSEILLNQEGTFEIQTNEISLAALANPTLTINDQYPSLSVTVTGIATLGQDGVGSLRAFNILINGTLLNGDNVEALSQNQVQEILAELNNLGIQIPEAQEEAPLNVDVTYQYDSENDSLVLSSDEEADLLIVFEGQRS